MTYYPATILGGLPVIADISFGRDDFTGEFYSDVEGLYWQKKDGSRGKELPQKVRDRAEKYDPMFCCLTEQVSENIAAEAERRYERD